MVGIGKVGREVDAQFFAFCTKLNSVGVKNSEDKVAIQRALIEYPELKTEYESLQNKVSQLQGYVPQPDSVEEAAFKTLFKNELKGLYKILDRAKEENDYESVLDLVASYVAHDKVYLLDTVLHSIPDEWLTKILEDKDWGDCTILQYSAHSNQKGVCEVLLQVAEVKGKAMDVLFSSVTKKELDIYNDTLVNVPYDAMRYAVEAGNQDVAALFFQFAEKHGKAKELLLSKYSISGSLIDLALKSENRTRLSKLFIQEALKLNFSISLFLNSKWLNNISQIYDPEFSMFLLEKAKSEGRAHELSRPDINYDPIRSAIDNEDEEFCKAFLQAVKDEGRLEDVLGQKKYSYELRTWENILQKATHSDNENIFKLFFAAAGKKKLELMKSDNVDYMHQSYFYFLQNPLTIKEALSEMQSKNIPNWQKTMIHQALTKLNNKPEQNQIAEAYDLYFILLSLSKIESTTPELDTALKNMVMETRKMIPFEKRLIAVTELIAFIEREKGSLKRYETLYKTLKAECKSPKDHKKLEALSSYFPILLNSYKDSDALDIARSFLANSSADSLESGQFRGMLAHTLQLTKDLYLKNQKDFLTLIANYTYSAKPLSSLIVLLRSILVLDAKEDLEQMVKEWPHYLAQAEEMVRQAEEQLTFCENEFAEYKKDHKEEYELYLNRSKEFGKIKKDIQKIEGKIKDLETNYKQEDREKKLKEQKLQLESLKNTLETSIRSFKKPKPINDINEAKTKLQEAKDLLKQVYAPDAMEMLCDLLEKKGEGIIDVNMLNTVREYFADLRSPSSPIIYLCNLLGITENENRNHAIADFNDVVQNLKNFQDYRYGIKNNPLLKKINSLVPGLLEKWRFLTSNQEHLKSLNERQFPLIEGKTNGPKEILLYALNDLPSEKKAWVEKYLKAEEEQKNEVLSELKEAIKSEDKEKDKNLLIAQQNLISLMMPLQGEDEIQSARVKIISLPGLLELPNDHVFVESLNELQKMIDPKEEKEISHLKLTLSDTPMDLIMVGTDVPGSCQKIDGNPNFNRGLISYMSNGGIIPFGHKDDNDQWVSRSLLRLSVIEDEKGIERPALLFERIYPAASGKKISDELRGGAALIAKTLGIDAITVFGNNEEFEKVKGEVFIDKGKAHSEYVDSAVKSEVKEGDKWPCRIAPCVYLYKHKAGAA